MVLVTIDYEWEGIHRLSTFAHSKYQGDAHLHNEYLSYRDTLKITKLLMPTEANHVWAVNWRIYI